jgi:hypothetical protein
MQTSLQGGCDTDGQPDLFHISKLPKPQVELGKTLGFENSLATE